MGKAAEDEAVQLAAVAPKRKTKSTAGLAEAKAATTMTSKEWQRHQVGMAAKWPQPEYMKLAHDRKSHTAYRDETYSLITRWTEDTRISYRPHAKAPGTKSHVRYESYSVARTVGEALELGTFPADWCWDYERGFIRVHGPVRDEPIDMSKVTDESTLTKVDNIIQRWYRRELAKNLGLSYEDLWVGKGSGESTLMRAHRLVAQREAKKRLEAAAAEGRRVTNEEVEKTLHEWAFARNPNRTNVMKEGQTWVWSDTLGLIIDRIGDIHITTPTVMYPAVTRILVQWLSDRLPGEVSDFGFTSINLNCNYAAAQHRDKNNHGPSLISAFGNFTGGELSYWPEDNKSSKLEDLPTSLKVQKQIGSGLMMFNGNCAHQVEDFQGERYSVVYFTSGVYRKAKPEIMGKLEELGFLLPPPEDGDSALLRAPRGYLPQQQPLAQAAAEDLKEDAPELRFWSHGELEAVRLTRKSVAALPEPEAYKSAGRPRLEKVRDGAPEKAKDQTPTKSSSNGPLDHKAAKRTAEENQLKASPKKMRKPMPTKMNLRSMGFIQVE